MISTGRMEAHGNTATAVAITISTPATSVAATSSAQVGWLSSLQRSYDPLESRDLNLDFHLLFAITLVSCWKRKICPICNIKCLITESILYYSHLPVRLEFYSVYLFNKRVQTKFQIYSIFNYVKYYPIRDSNTWYKAIRDQCPSRLTMFIIQLGHVHHYWG